MRRPPRSTRFPYTTLFRSGSFTGVVPTYTAPSSVEVDFLLAVPSGGATDGQIICRFTTSGRSEEHTSELQSQFHLVCRLLLEKKNTATSSRSAPATASTPP